MSNKFLPISRPDMQARGWNELDIILVSGDAYVDHPSYCTAVIGRMLEDAGFRVGIIAQPGWATCDDFKRLGRPELFFGVTAGNLDSMVANYTANRNERNNDDYSPGGRPGLRPDRSCLIYTNKIKEAYPDIPVMLGGLEASMRRLAHYDYWSDTVRRSILLDSKADILVYGMGEKQVMEIAGRLKKGKLRAGLDNIKGTVIVRNTADAIKDCIVIPSFEEVSYSKDKFCEALKTVYLESDPFRGHTIIQKHASRYIIQFPPALPLATEELDKIYSLSYARRPHPIYDNKGGVAGFETVRQSITSHRGCPGGCNFCSLYLHQGRIIQSRSRDSIIKEVKALAQQDDFKGTITDIGGPTANLYKAECTLWKTSGACSSKNCLTPDKCSNLKLGYEETMKLWSDVMNIPKVKHLFIGSGVRYDLLTDKYSDRYLKQLCAHHVSGRLKVAPEHSEITVLKLMNKPSFGVYEKFVRRFWEMNSETGKKQYLVNYFIVGHPGSRLEDALKLSLELIKRNIHPKQVQDFIPLPMTVSGCMYYTQKDPFTGKRVYVAKGLRERKLQRALIQHAQPKNRKYVIEALRRLGRMDLSNKFLARVNPRAIVSQRRLYRD